MSLGITKSGKICKKCKKQKELCTQHSHTPSHTPSQSHSHTPSSSPESSSELIPKKKMSPVFQYYEQSPNIVKQQIMLNLNRHDLHKLVSMSKSSKEISDLPTFKEKYTAKHFQRIYLSGKQKMYDAMLIPYQIRNIHSGLEREVFKIGGYVIEDGRRIWKEKKISKNVADKFKAGEI
jgi:hypothetical protein